MSRSRAAAAGWVVDLGAQALAEDSAMMRGLSITIRSSADLTYRKSLVAFEGQRLAATVRTSPSDAFRTRCWHRRESAVGRIISL